MRLVERFVSTALAAGLAFFAAQSDARAETTVVQCDFGNGGGFVVTIDYSARTIVSFVSAFADGTSREWAGFPARAEIDSTHVKWVMEMSHPDGENEYTLNRSTGVLYEVRSNPYMTFNYPCHLYQPPTPKF